MAPMSSAAATSHAPAPAIYQASLIKRPRSDRWQIEEWDLPTRPTKASDTRAKNFGDISVELNAIDPDRLRSLVAEASEKHLPKQQLSILKAAEESERDIIRQLVGDAVKGARQ